MTKIIDNGTFLFKSNKINLLDTVENIKKITGSNGELDNNKYIFRNVKIEKLEFINFITALEFKKNVSIVVSFSYSRFENEDNYKLATRQRTINDVHSAILRFYRAVTSLLITTQELEVLALDISNQLEVENVRNYYNVLALIYRAYKKTNNNGRMYFDIDEAARLELDGLDFREQGKKRRESQSYFKIYSKRKEIENTKGKLKAVGKHTALRGELTLKGLMLKKYDLHIVENINKKNLEKVLKIVLAKQIIKGINKELDFNMAELRKAFMLYKTKRIRENIFKYQYLFFDMEQLEGIFTPDILDVGARQCRDHKKAAREILKELGSKGEIKKTFEGNFERLKKLLKKIVKAEIEIKNGVIEWLE